MDWLTRTKNSPYSMTNEQYQIIFGYYETLHDLGFNRCNSYGHGCEIARYHPQDPEKAKYQIQLRDFELTIFKKFRIGTIDIRDPNSFQQFRKLFE